MADLEEYCATCDKNTPHTHIKARKAICAECGGWTTLAKEPVIERPKVELEISREDDMASSTRKRLSEQEKADIIRRSGEGASFSVLAADFGVAMSTVKRIVKLGGGTEAGAAGKPGRKPGRRKGMKLRQVETPAASKFSLRELIEQRVAEAVDARLAELDLEAKIEAALARMLK